MSMRPICMHGTKLGREIERELAKGFSKKEPSNAKKTIPADAAITVEKVSRIIRTIIDQMNFKGHLQYTIEGEPIDEINKILSDSPCKTKALLRSVLEDILNRTPKYPISEIGCTTEKDAETDKRILKSIAVTCYTIWTLPD
ncbi:MAG: hypothetical protein JXA94_00515 [Parachlamydiales bacterium]|nr:hypothetical protein [Parachlamydiales bacterium]